MLGRRLAAFVFVAALVGGLTGALVAVVVVVVVQATGDPERGSVLRTGVRLFEDGSEMWCNDFHRFCMPRFEHPEEARAFYLGETGDLRRKWACFVEWRADYDATGVAPSGEQTTGAFRGTCSGSIFLRDGTRVFGPAPRDLDEFRVTYHEQTEVRDGQELDVSYFEVDTRTLICGDYTAGATDRGCELAPPFD